MIKHIRKKRSLLLSASMMLTLLLWGGLAMGCSKHAEDRRMGEPVRHSEGEAQPCINLWIEPVSEAKVGETVLLALKLENICEHPLEIFFGGRPAHDFVVSTADGREVWRWLHGADIQMILQVRTVSLGEVLTFTAAWNQRDNAGKPVAPGDYLVLGRLHGDPPQLLESRPEPLVISP